MSEFIRSDFEDNFESMYKSLMHLETLVSPSVDNSAIEKNLEIIRVHMDKMERRDSDGNVVCSYPVAQRQVQKLLHKTHGLILQLLDEQGILKKIQSDPRHAMSNFSGS